jgi:hypothetical protein
MISAKAIADRLREDLLAAQQRGGAQEVTLPAVVVEVVAHLLDQLPTAFVAPPPERRMASGPGIVPRIADELERAMSEQGRPADVLALPMPVVTEIAQLLAEAVPMNVDMNPADRLRRVMCGDPVCQALSDVHDLARWVTDQECARMDGDRRARVGRMAEAMCEAVNAQREPIGVVYSALLAILVDVCRKLASVSHLPADEPDPGAVVH